MGIGVELGLRNPKVNKVIVVDGVTYSATGAGIQSAIDALPAEGGMIVLPEGTYLASSLIDVDSKSNIDIMGVGPGSIVKIADNTTAAIAGDMHNLFRVLNSSYITFKNLALDGNYQNQAMALLAKRLESAREGMDAFTIQYTGAGSAASLTIAGNVLTTTCTGAAADNLSLDLTASANDTIAKLETVIEAHNGGGKYAVVLNSDYLTNSYTPGLVADTYADIKTAATGIAFANPTRGASTYEVHGNNIYISGSDHVTVDHCRLDNAPHMGVLITKGSSSCRVTNNYGTYCNWRAVEIWSDGNEYPSNNVVSENIFGEAYLDTIMAEYNAYGNTIINNVCEKTDLAFDDGDLYGIGIYYSPRNIVSGNVLRGCGFRLSGSDSKYNVFTGNTVDGREAETAAEVRGIFISSATHNVVSGNVFENLHLDGFRLNSSASNNLICGNLIDGANYGIIVLADCEDNMCIDNRMLDCTHEFYDTGTRTFLSSVKAGVNTLLLGAMSGRVNPRTASGTTGTLTPDVDAADHYNAVGLTGAVTFAIPSGTPVNGQKLTIRIEDNGTTRALGWNAIYRVVGQTLPTDTTVGKLIYVGLIYNTTDTKWDVVAVTEEA